MPDSSRRQKPYNRSGRNIPGEVNSTLYPIFEHGKIPPQAIELEEAVLGAMMLETHRVEEVLRILPLGSFYKESHNIIYSAIRKLFDTPNMEVDILTVTEYLRSTGELEAAGGAYNITMMTNRVASTANIEVHAGIVLQKSISRQIISLCSEASRMAYEDGDDFDAPISILEQGIQTVIEQTAFGGNMKHIAAILDKTREALKHRIELSKTGHCIGVTSGLIELDRATRGWLPAELVVVAARPGMGKTAMMLKWAKSAARSGVPVCIYSLEMSEVSLSNRLILSECDIDVEKFMTGRGMTDLDWDEYERAEANLRKLPIYVDDNPVVSTRYIKTHSRMMKKKGMCGAIFVDYLQLADVKSESDNNTTNREQQVAKASRDCKIIAKELEVPFILLAQLNRAVEIRGGTKRPILSDLRESGAIEQDADKVIFLYRPAMYGIKDDEGGDNEGLGECIIAKNRDGGITDVAFEHNPSMTKIFDYGAPKEPVWTPTSYANEIIGAHITANTTFYPPMDVPEIPF